MLEAKNLEKQILLKKIDNQTLNIKIFDNKLLLAIVGEFNNNLSELEKLTNTKLFFRGNSITAKGILADASIELSCEDRRSVGYWFPSKLGSHPISTIEAVIGKTSPLPTANDEAYKDPLVKTSPPNKVVP